MKIVPVTCMYAGKADCSAMVEAAIRVHQNNDEAVAFGLTASCVLEAVLLGSPIGQSMEKCGEGAPEVVKSAFQVAKDAAASGTSLKDLLGEVGRSCALPASFIGPVHQFQMAADSSSGNLYVEAVRENILAGGDTCSRAVFVGAVIAAANGGPPASWVDKMEKSVLNKVDMLANAIANTATGNSEL